MNETGFSRLAAFLALMMIALLAACSADPGPPPLAGARLGGPFSLVDQDGRRSSDRNFAGRYRIAYFGFTHCPDVCPTDLAQIGAALRRFEVSDPALAARIAPLFITVDPERDTPAALKTFVSAFHPRLVGLTGTREEIAAMARAHGVYYARGETATEGGYSMDHSRNTILYGPEGEPIVILPVERGADAIVADLERWVR